ncbi:MAG: hypothetical protein ACK4GN_06285 [Runella sp.]
MDPFLYFEDDEETDFPPASSDPDSKEEPKVDEVIFTLESNSIESDGIA